MKTTHKTKAIGIVLLASVFLLMAAGSGSSSKSEKATKVGEVTQAAPAENNGSSAENTDSNNNEQPNEQQSDTEAETPATQESYHVGDILQTKDLKVVYVSSGEYTSDNQFLQPKEGNKFIFIELYCENISDSDARISSASFECYADGYSCESAYLPENELSATLSAGRSTSGRVGFEVPANATDIQIEYEVSGWTQEKAVLDFEGTQDSGFVPEANAEATADAYKVGDIIESKALNITYLSCGEYQSDNMFDVPKEGYHYVYIELEFENISDSDKYVSYFEFDCFADGASCDAYYGMDSNLSATLSPGRKTKGTVAFEVPVNAANVEIEYLTNLFTSNRIVFSYQP